MALYLHSLFGRYINPSYQSILIHLTLDVLRREQFTMIPLTKYEMETIKRCIGQAIEPQEQRKGQSRSNDILL